MRRPRRPNINTIRERKFSEHIKGLKHLPNNGIIQRIDSKMFSLDGNRLYHYKPDLLASEEYKRCLALFEKRLPYEHSKTTASATKTFLERLEDIIKPHMQLQELIHKDTLEQLAVDTIREMFNIPEHIQLLPEINISLDVGAEEQDDSPQPFLSLDDEDKRKMRDEIQKRVILNGLVHGAAMHIWKSAHYIVKDKIDELDPNLMTMYNEYTAGIGWTIWMMPPDQVQETISAGDAMTQGFNQLEFEEEDEPDCEISCYAVNFPVLLHEVAKGAMDYLIARGIPRTYTDEELRYYYAEADSYENELWHYLMSPSLWTALIAAADVTTQEIPAVIANLTALSYQELTELLRACIDGKEEGASKLNQFRIV